MTGQSRQPAGVPVGGQFTSTVKAEVDVALQVPTTGRFGANTGFVDALLDRIDNLTGVEARELARTPEDALVDDAYAAMQKSARKALDTGLSLSEFTHAEDAYRRAWFGFESNHPDPDSPADVHGANNAATAAFALALRGVIPRYAYDSFTRPARLTLGRIHPDDDDLKGSR